MTNHSAEDAEDWRNHFLLHLYDKIWDSIDRAESGVWQFVAFYAVVAVLVLGASTGTLDATAGTVLALIVSFWGMNVAINAGKWVNRNLMFAVNIEKQFLYQDDPGRILPTSYHKRKPRTLNWLNATHFVAFVAIALLSMHLGWPTSWCSAFWLFGTLIVASGFTACHFFGARAEVRAFVQQTDPDLPIAG